MKYSILLVEPCIDLYREMHKEYQYVIRLTIKIVALYKAVQYHIITGNTLNVKHYI